MKILLISPWDKRRLRYRSPLSFLISYPPLTLPMLAALVPSELNAEIIVHDEISDKKTPLGTFDVVGITVIASESTRAYELADYYRGQGAFVVLGGYHVTFLPDEALEHADAIVSGEGLAAWPKLLRDFAANKLSGNVYFDGDMPVTNKPIPKRDILKSRAYAPVDTILASNGCPNKCAFCSIKKMAQFSCRPVDEVITELHSLKHRLIIFYDPNFFANRSYALELMKAMEPLRLRWGATATVDFGFDDELMKAARKSGCYGVLIGFESLNAAALSGANKSFSNPDRYREAIENIHRHRMTINGTFVIGLDEDTEEGLAALPDGVRKLGIDLPIYFILTPTPGNTLYHEMKAQDRLLTDDWSRYTQAEVVFKPQNMTPEQLLILYRHAWRRTYTLWSILRRVLRAPGASLHHKLVVLCLNVGFKFMGRDREHI
jgi:radical SAM superfamily enzyme YgiQ (UPF0313 family)